MLYRHLFTVVILHSYVKSPESNSSDFFWGGMMNHFVITNWLAIGEPPKISSEKMYVYRPQDVYRWEILNDFKIHRHFRRRNEKDMWRRLELAFWFCETKQRINCGSHVDHGATRDIVIP